MRLADFVVFVVVASYYVGVVAVRKFPDRRNLDVDGLAILDWLPGPELHGSAGAAFQPFVPMAVEEVRSVTIQHRKGCIYLYRIRRGKEDNIH